jgi:hypothetical protein
MTPRLNSRLRALGALTPFRAGVDVAKEMKRASFVAVVPELPVLFRVGRKET